MINNIKCWICGSDKILKVNLVVKEKVTHYHCKNCYFIFSNEKILKLKKIKYYSNISYDTLKKRYFYNEYFDSARFINYINLIKKKCNFYKKTNHLDIGGGFGFFSKVLKKKFPKINTFNLEPDINAAKVARRFNKSTNIITSRFEDIKSLKKYKFDLVTYWGGIYRTVEPHKVFQNLKKICKKKCDFFFSLPFSFDDMRLQHLVLRDSFDEYLLSKDGAKGLFGRKHMELFLNKNKFFFKEIMTQNKPFKKRIPIFHFNSYKNTTRLKKKNFKNYFIQNIKLYNLYFFDQINEIIKSEKKCKKFFICGDAFLTKLAQKYVQRKKIKNISVLSGNAKNIFNNKKELNSILDLGKTRSSVFLIFENKNYQPIKSSLVKRFHLNKTNSIYFLEKDFSFKKDVFDFNSNLFLKKKIKLIKI